MKAYIVQFVFDDKIDFVKIIRVKDEKALFDRLDGEFGLIEIGHLLGAEYMPLMEFIEKGVLTGIWYGHKTISATEEKE